MPQIKKPKKPRSPNYGGYREGGGRPPGSKNESTRLRDEARAQIQKKLMEKQGEVIESLLYLACPPYELEKKTVQVKRKNGKISTREIEVRKYERTPDTTAIKELLDRMAGKSVQGVEMGDSDGNPIQFILR